MKQLFTIMLSVVIVTAAQAQKERSTLVIGRAPTGFNKLNYFGASDSGSKVHNKPDADPCNKHPKTQRKRRHTAVKLIGLAAIALIPVLIISNAMSHPFGDGIMVK